MGASHARTVCVDLDGTLNTYAGWRGPDTWYPPRPGAARFLQELRAHGYRVVVFTTRHADGVWSWLRSHGIADLVDDVTDVKHPAFVYVDDRGIPFRGDYDETLRAIETFRPYWKTDEVTSLSESRS